DASTTPVGDGRHDLGDVVEDLALALGGCRVPRHARVVFVDGVGLVGFVYEGEAVGGVHYHDVTCVTGGDVVQVGAQVVEGAEPIRVIGQPDHVEVDTVFGRGVEPPAEHGVVATFGQVHHDLGRRCAVADSTGSRIQELGQTGPVVRGAGRPKHLAVDLVADLDAVGRGSLV